jgi:hypothetical protein
VIFEIPQTLKSERALRRKIYGACAHRGRSIISDCIAARSIPQICSAGAKRQSCLIISKQNSSRPSSALGHQPPHGQVGRRQYG